MVTLSAPQTTGLTTGSGVLINDAITVSPTNNHLGYSSPGRFFMSYFTGSTGTIAAKLTGNIGSLFDGTLAYQWVDISEFVNGGATLSTFSTPTVTITGMNGIPPTVVGQQITISNAANGANNGTFPIVSWISSTSITYNNPAAVTPDNGGGSLAYNIQCNIPVGNASGNIGGGTPGDIVAIIPTTYAGGINCNFFFQFQLTFVSGTTFIGENSAAGFIGPWMTIEMLGAPQ